PLGAVRAQVFNVGSEAGNFTKSEVVEFVRRAIPGVAVETRDLSFGGDMRDVAVDCSKLRERLGFTPGITVVEGIVEVRDAIAGGLIADPRAVRYRNHTPIIQ